MKYPQPKLACTSSGLSLQEWKRRPVYKVHCFTFAIASELCGVRRTAAKGLVSTLTSGDADALSLFRALSPHRSAVANQLRDCVAAEVRALRRELLTMV